MEKIKKQNFFRRTFQAVTGLKSRKAFSLPYIAFMLIFVVLPLIVILFRAFLSPPDTNGVSHFTFSNFLKIFTSSDMSFFKILFRSLYIGLLNSAICLLLGYPIAYLLSQQKYNKSTTTYMLFVLPIWMNFLIRTIATKALFEYVGIEIAGDMFPVMFGMVYNFLPFMILPIYNVLSKMDKSLIEASTDLGANSRQVFTKTVVPLSMSGIVSGVLMVFMPTITTYVITDTLSNRQIALLGNLLYLESKKTSPSAMYVASALSVLLLLLIGATMLFSNKFDKLGEDKGEGLW